MMQHGLSGYRRDRCRCDICRQANTDYCAEARARRLEREVPAKVHGTTGGYANWGCRCPECSVAWADKCAMYWATHPRKALTAQQRKAKQAADRERRRRRYWTDPDYRNRILRSNAEWYRTHRKKVA